MTINYNRTGEDRKSLVADITGAEAKYLGAPSFAYQVDYFTIDRNGAVTFDDRADSEEIENLIERLADMGFVAQISGPECEAEEVRDGHSDPHLRRHGNPAGAGAVPSQGWSQKRRH